MESIDRDIDTPVYEQLADILRKRITSGAIPPRRALPSIRTLCQEFGVARMTAMKAVGVLADEGRIRMVRGRGWYVRDISGS